MSDFETVTAENRVDAVLADFANGSLSRASSVLVAAHLELRPENLGWVENLEAAGGAMLDEMDTAPVADRAAMLQAIFESDPETNITIPPKRTVDVTSCGLIPPSLEAYLGTRFDAIQWRGRLPGLKEYRIEHDEDVEASLLWIKAGQAMPTHTHEGTELTLVLKGSFDDGNGHFKRGDIAVADDTVDHRPIAGADEDCICFAVNDAPLRLTGPIGRFFAPFMGR